MSSDLLVAIVMVVGLIIGLCMGGHIGIVLGAVAVIVGLWTWGPSVLTLFGQRIFGMFTDYLLVAIPLFVFMGFILEKTGLGEMMFEGLGELFGPVRGGLAIGLMIVSTILAACTGVIPTAIVSAGAIGMPIMLRKKYDPSLVFGTVAAGGALGVMIPPSVMLIFYASQAGLSVGDVYGAALIPGLILALAYMIFIAIACFLRPKMGPPVERAANVGASVKKIITGLAGTVVLVAAVLGTILTGIATATEASGAGVVGAILLAVIYRKFKWSAIKDAAQRTIGVMGMFGVIMLGASCFAAIFVSSGGSKVIGQLIMGLQLGSTGTLIFVLLIMIILGMFVDWLSIFFIALPVVLVILPGMGWNPLWFAVLVALAMETGFLTPPFGFALFYVKGIAPQGSKTIDIWRGAMYYVGVIVVVMVLVGIFPQLALWLPSVMYK